MEISLNHDNLAKIQQLQVVLGSKAFALALLPRTVDSCCTSPSCFVHVEIRLDYTRSRLNVTSGCVIHFHAVKRNVPLALRTYVRADCAACTALLLYIYLVCIDGDIFRFRFRFRSRSRSRSRFQCFPVTRANGLNGHAGITYKY